MIAAILGILVGSLLAVVLWFAGMNTRLLEPYRPPAPISDTEYYTFLAGLVTAGVMSVLLAGRPLPRTLIVALWTALAWLLAIRVIYILIQ